MKIMKSRCIEIMRISQLLLKKCSWTSLICLSLAWCIFAVIAYAGFLSDDMLSNIKNIYTPNGGSLLYVLIFYLSFGIEMIMVTSYLKHPLCEEYYYTRITDRTTIISANILAIVVINVAIILLEIIGITLFLFLLGKCTIKKPDIFVLLQILAASIIQRLTLSFVLLLGKKLGKNIATVFIILTVIIFSSILIDSDMFNTIRNWLDVSRMSGMMLGMEGLLAIVLVCVVIGIDYSRDISLQEDLDKNDQ